MSHMTNSGHQLMLYLYMNLFASWSAYLSTVLSILDGTPSLVRNPFTSAKGYQHHIQQSSHSRTSSQLTRVNHLILTTLLEVAHHASARRRTALLAALATSTTNHLLGVAHQASTPALVVAAVTAAANGVLGVAHEVVLAAALATALGVLVGCFGVGEEV